MRRLRISALTIIILLCLASCDLNTPYHHFEEIQFEGWDKEDTLHFFVDSLRQSGRYTLSLETRISDQYPYRNLSMMVEESVINNSKHKVLRRYPVEFEPRAEDGNFEGIGLGQHEQTKVLDCQYLHRGDSIHIKVYHKMRRLVMPGVTDIGIKLEK